MKKQRFIILLFLMIFLLTGCEPKVTYEILDGKMTETVEMNIGSAYSEKRIQELADYYSFSKENGYLTSVEQIANGYNVKTSMEKEIDLEAYFESDLRFINQCYEIVSFTYEKEEKKYYLGTSKGFECMTYDYNHADKIDVTIKTYNKVYNHNADEAKNGEYTWHITRDNAEKNNILFVVGKGTYVWYYQYRYLFIGLISVAIFAVIMYIIIGIFRHLSKRANKI